MARTFDLYEDLEEETTVNGTIAGGGDRSRYPLKADVSEPRKAKALIRRARDKNILKSMENPFENDLDIMQYLDRAIDNSRNPLDQLELKMLHESLCREIHKEKFRKGKI